MDDVQTADESGGDPMQFIFTKDSFRPDIPADTDLQAWEQAFSEDRYEALYRLGLQGAARSDSPSFTFMSVLSTAFLASLTDQPDIELLREKAEAPLTDLQWQKLNEAVPFAIGAEFIDRNWAERQFSELLSVFRREIRGFDGSVALYLADRSQNLHVPERVFFHLVENDGAGEDSGQFPFAFLATYATQEPSGKVRHMPLQYALTEYRTDRTRLVSLLSCLSRAAEVSPLIDSFMQSGELFHPLRLTAAEAYEFLKSVPEIESTGILCRIPNWWKQKNSTISLQIRLGEKQPSLLGFDALVSASPELMVNGESLTAEEIEELLRQSEGLRMIKGKWVEIDHARLKELLKQLKKNGGDVTLLGALRMGLEGGNDADADVGPLVTNGKWLSSLLQNLRQPGTIRASQVPRSFRGTLRPYQKTGYSWMQYMNRLGFGACLADDMGLGKTIEVITFLEYLRKNRKDAKGLLIVPASLLGNWESELQKFAPAMTYQILHGRGDSVLTDMLRNNTAFLTITTYGMASHLTELRETVWDCLILDEAQAIKNPGTKQTQSIKKLQAKGRIAMTGTPIENELTNLWSLFDFLDKGLLGTSKEFSDYAKRLTDHPEGYARLRALVSPFILRRVKTDRRIISDLPDKMEIVDYCPLSKKQIVLYRKQIRFLEESIGQTDGIQRKGLVLASLTKLKQICNHPDQYLGQEDYAPEESGKFGLLRELCETIYEKRERVIVFTQYREITEFLAAYLTEIFHARGLVLHGGTPVRQRTAMVREFNGEDYVPFMVLSVKAGGTGLNLTAANHVIHFDRWWNPAVENQATDRAFRIGQERNVMVHKFVCKGTVEEKIDALINSKKELADNVIGNGGESWLTKMDDRELLDVLRLRL